VTSIAGEAFYNCTGLTSVICLSEVPPTVGISALSRLASSVCLYVPEASIPAYGSADRWKDLSCIKSKDEYVSVITPARVITQAKPLMSLMGNTLKLSAPDNSVYGIRLIDVRGKTVARYKSSGGSSISLAKIPAGRYFVEARGVGKVERLAVVVGVR